VLVVQQRLDDAGDAATDIGADDPEAMHQSLAIDRSNQLTLDVAKFVEPGIGYRVDFNVERETAVCSRQRSDNDKGKIGPECIGRAEDQCGSVGRWFTWVGVTEVNDP